MEKFKKEANKAFFEKVIMMTEEGGAYGYPAARQKYTVRGGKLYGTKEGVEILKEITPKSFHKNIKLEEK